MFSQTKAIARTRYPARPGPGQSLPAAMAALLLAGLLVGCSGEGDSEAGGEMTAESIDEMVSDMERTAGNGKITGTVEGSIGDQEGPWNVLSLEVSGEEMFTGQWTDMMNVQTYTVQGHEGRSFTVANSVSIEVTTNRGRTMTFGDVSWFPESGLSPVYVMVDNSVSVEFELLEESGDEAQVRGTATGTFYRLEEYGSGEPDMNESVSVDLSFEATLTKLEI